MESSNNSKVGVMIATPLRAFHGFESLPENMRKTMDELTHANTPFEFQFAVSEGSIVRNRNMLADSFLSSACKWLLWWDDDIEATACDVLKLLSAKKPVVGGLYTTREPRSHYVANFLHEAELHGDLFQVLECGTGFKLYHRQVFEQVAKLKPEIGYVDRDSGRRINGFFQHCVLRNRFRPDGDLISEDYFMDDLCRQVGIPVFVNTAVRVHHRHKDGTLYPTEWPTLPIHEADSHHMHNAGPL